MKFTESGIAENYSKLLNEKGYNFAVNHVDKMANILFNGVAAVLRDAKSVEVPTAFVFENLNAELITACVCQFHDGADGNPGSWSLSWTFDKDDIKDCKVLKMTDSQVIPSFTHFAGITYGLRFDATEYCVVLMLTLVSVISQWLDDNASTGTEDEPTEVSLDDVFVGYSYMDGDKIVKSIESSGSIKKIIKDDDAIAK